MGHINGEILLLVILVAALVILCFRRWRLLEALIEEIDNRRGGPPTAMHPSPSNDGALLRRRSRKIEN